MSFKKNPPKTIGNFSSSSSWSGVKKVSYVKGLLSGTKWGNKNPDNIKKIELLYYLSGKGDSYEEKYTPLNIHSYEKKAMKNAMKSFSDVANISFKKTSNTSKANIKWGILNNTQSNGSLGMAYLPNGYILSGLTTANSSFYENYGSKSLNPGSYFFLTYIHELGHSLGLKHPHEKNDYYGTFPGVSNGSSKDFGHYNLNGSPWTVMTYNELNSKGQYNPKNNSFDGFSTGLGAFDIAAIQYLYGANKNKNKGNNIYKLSSKLNGFNCIWDTGGVDIIDASSASGSTTINLNNATLEKEKGGGGFISQINGEYKGYTIAYKTEDKKIKCIIENATGSDFDDHITGNSAKNNLKGDSGNDKLIGGSGNDKLIGGSGNDKLIGGKGNDKLIGGKGNDIFKLSTGKGYDLIQDFKNKQDKIFIGSMKKLKFKNKGNDVFIYKGKDLLANVKGAKGDLSKKGKYLV